MAGIATVTTRPLARLVATVLPARSICDNNQPPKISPAGLASAGIAMARSAGSVFGGASVASLALIVIFSSWALHKRQPTCRRTNQARASSRRRNIHAGPLYHRLRHLIEPLHDRLHGFSRRGVEHEVLLLHQIDEPGILHGFVERPAHDLHSLGRNARAH